MIEGGCRRGEIRYKVSTTHMKEFLAMKTISRLITLTLGAVLALSLAGCAPEIGSDKWCANLKAKPKGDWSLNEAADYAKHCILK